MAKYYYNGAEILAPLTIRSNEPIYHADTISLKTQRSSYGHQRWEISFNTLLTEDTHIDGMLSSIIEASESDTMVMPQLKKVADTTTVTDTTPSVNANASIGDSIVYMRGTGVSGKIPKGAFIKFSNHSKVYMVKSDCVFTGTGSSALFIYPNLRANLTALTHTAQVGDLCTISYYRDINDIKGISFTDGVLSNTGQVNLIEAV